ncbi:MAG: binding-protein-dependent transport system inner rane component [Dehalococcoidia bacterium]|nr:binding-protein-dependent transport system inner rane component [Dehalococcoidia bacterium]
MVLSKKETALAAVLLIVLWQVAAMMVARTILPPPTEVARTFFVELPRGLGRHIAVSWWRCTISLGIAVLVGVPLGLALGQGGRLGKLLAPFIYITYPIPKIVLLPILLLVLGIGEASKIFLISLILAYQVVIVVRDAASNIRPELIYSVRSLGAGSLQLLRHVYFPACLPSTITALRLSSGTAIAVLYIAESFATKSGLGFYIMDTWQTFAYRQMYSAVVAMSLLGLGIYIGLDRIEGWLCRWVRAGGT